MMTTANEDGSLAECSPEELRAVIDIVYEKTGADFRQYGVESLKRRVLRCANSYGMKAWAPFRARLAADPAAMERLRVALTVPVTAMFRDPVFFSTFRDQAVPLLRTHPFLRLWVAGCSTGEEVYSLAIVLHEQGLYERSQIYATDLNDGAVAASAAGVLPVASIGEYAANYREYGRQSKDRVSPPVSDKSAHPDHGPRRSFSDYYRIEGEQAVLQPFLRENIVFARHNLATDASFNECHVIFCRNVMIYFNRELQRRAHRLLYDSLRMFGYLGLGRSESIRFSSFEEHYAPLAGRERIYRKIR